MYRSGFSSIFPAAARARRRWLALPLLLAALAAVSLAWAQAPAPSDAAKAEALAVDQKLIADAKNNSEIIANLTYLSDVIGPRLTGSANLKRANDWTAEKMKSYGLTNVHQEGWTIPIGWERGTATARLIEPDNGRAIFVASQAWMPGTNGKIVGDVVYIASQKAEDLAKYKGKLKNAVILRSPPANVRPISEYANPPAGNAGRPGEAAKPGAAGQRGGRGQAPPMGGRNEFNEFLRQEGAAAILMDAGKPHGLMTMGGGWRGNDRVTALQQVPSLYVPHEHYALLYRLATRPEPARTRLELEVNNTIVPGPITVYNTVGEIKGSEKPDEFVIVGAHLDSWDLATGSTDNGTGSCVVLEVARILARSEVKPKRTIRFVLFSGEEQGLQGSRMYVQQHKDELPKMSMCIVHDAGTGKVLGLALQGREAVKPVLEPELVSLRDLGFKELTMRSSGGTDHLSFDNQGVPGFAVQQDMSEYRLMHHSQTDTLDKAREPDLIQGAQVMAVTAMRVANLPDLLPRTK